MDGVRWPRRSRHFHIACANAIGGAAVGTILDWVTGDGSLECRSRFVVPPTVSSSPWHLPNPRSTPPPIVRTRFQGPTYSVLATLVPWNCFCAVVWFRAPLSLSNGRYDILSAARKAEKKKKRDTKTSFSPTFSFFACRFHSSLSRLSQPRWHSSQASSLIGRALLGGWSVSP